MNTTKKLNSLLLALLLPVITMALPPYTYDNYEFEVDGIYYKLEGSEACVTYQLWNGSHVSDYHGDVVIPSTVTYQEKTYPVTRIDSYAFNYCSGLTSITIPASIKSIGGSAFYLCTGLTCVNISDIEAWLKMDISFNPLQYAQHLYLNGTEVTDLTIPDGITTIGKYAFLGCTGLTSVTIPNSVTAIGENAFNACTGLTSASIPNSVTSIGQVAFAGCTSLTTVSIGNAVTTISNNAFDGCTALTSVSIPNSVTEIGVRTFMGCTSLTSAIIGNRVNTIGGGAFMGCKALTSIKIPNLVTEIGDRAFKDCTTLSSVTIGKSVTTIGKEAFQNDPAIETIICKATTPPAWSDLSMFSTNVYNHTPLYVPKGYERAYMSDMGWGQFVTIVGVDMEEATTDRVQIDGIYYVLNEEDGTAMVTNYTGGSTVVSGKEYRGDIVIPPSVTADDGMTYTVTAIGPYAFTECHDLTSLTIPNTVTEIGYESINGCTSLTSISIPNSVTRIGEHAFMNCTALESIDIPNSVISIGDCAFVRTPWYESQPDGVVYAGLVAYHYKGVAPENTEVVIQDGTIGIADGAFLVDEDRYPTDNFEGICSVVIPNSVKYLGENAFLGDDMKLNKVTIGNGVEAMGRFALAWNFNLSEVNIGEGVKVIGEQMFAGCPALKEITIPNSVEVIKYRAFSAMEYFGNIEYPACESLADVTIGSGVKSIEALAFSGCQSLTTITCLATTPPVLADGNCFDDECYENATLLVPAEAVDVYRTAPIWERFVNIQPVGGDNDITYEYVPFVREGVKWTYSIQDYHYEKDYGTNPARGDNKVYRTLEFRGDTVINGKTYKALHKCTDDVYSEPSDVIPIYLREEDKKVYGIVPDGIFYDDAGICITPYGLAPDDVILSGEEFLLYDFQDPVSYWDNLIDDDWFNLQLQLDTIEVGGHYAKRLFDSRQEGDYFQVIEGIGAMGMNSYPLAFLMPVTTGIHTTEYYNLEKVVENGEVIYPKDYVEDRYLPVIREGMKWVNEYVKISDEDTTSYYYTYEFKGNYPELDSYNRVFKAVYSKNYDANGVGNGDERLVAGLQEDEACILCFKNEPLGRRENFINFYTYQGNEDVCLLHENLERMYDIDYYINSQFDPDKNFLNTDNFVKADPIVIDGVLCSRIAYIGEQGDTLAYLVEGIGFDSRNLGDLLTPFTRYPDADCGCYIEYCGLSHVIKDGKIIYKGRLYQDGVTVGLDELPGDVNGDGSVNISDADNVIVIIINGGNGHDRVNEHGELIGDVNHDRVVNITDLNLIIDMIIKE